MVTDTVPSPVTPAFMKGILNSCLLVACPHIPSSSMELTHAVLYRNYCSRGTELGSEELGSRSYSKSRTELKRERRCPRVQVTCSHRARHHCSCSACRGTQSVILLPSTGEMFSHVPRRRRRRLQVLVKGVGLLTWVLTFQSPVFARKDTMVYLWPQATEMLCKRRALSTWWRLGMTGCLLAPGENGFKVALPGTRYFSHSLPSATTHFSTVNGSLGKKQTF